jgi:hypothetical protein
MTWFRKSEIRNLKSEIKKPPKEFGGRGVQKIIEKNDPAGFCPSPQAANGLLYNRRPPDLKRAGLLIKKGAFRAAIHQADNNARTRIAFL